MRHHLEAIIAKMSLSNWILFTDQNNCYGFSGVLDENHMILGTSLGNEWEVNLIKFDNGKNTCIKNWRNVPIETVISEAYYEIMASKRPSTIQFLDVADKLIDLLGISDWKIYANNGKLTLNGKTANGGVTISIDGSHIEIHGEKYQIGLNGKNKEENKK
jgi:hypothetical protein